MPDPLPRLSRWVASRLLPAEAREFVLGDLDEEYRRHVLPRLGRLRAAAWYRSQLCRSWWQFRRDRASRAAPRAPKGKPMQTLAQDVRFAARTLRRTPSFALLVVCTLGLGIGATTAIFSAVNEIMLRPLSFADPDRLVMLWEANQERGWAEVHAAPANVEDWRERVPAFADVAMINDFTSGVALAGSAEPVQVVSSTVSGNAFRVLGTPPLLGRTFLPEDDQPQAEPVVLLGHTAWQRYFAGDPGVVERTVLLDGTSHRVIGVMGPDFRYGFNDAEMWTTFRFTAHTTRHASPALPDGLAAAGLHRGRGGRQRGPLRLPAGAPHGLARRVERPRRRVAHDHRQPAGAPRRERPGGRRAGSGRHARRRRRTPGPQPRTAPSGRYRRRREPAPHVRAEPAPRDLSYRSAARRVRDPTGRGAPHPWRDERGCRAPAALDRSGMDQRFHDRGLGSRPLRDRRQAPAGVGRLLRDHAHPDRGGRDVR